MLLTAEAAATSGGAAGLFQIILPFAVMMIMLYFLVIRPQKTQEKARQQMLDEIKVGDHVVSIGGVYGEITMVKEDYVKVKVADKMEIKLSRSGVGSVETK